MNIDFFNTLDKKYGIKLDEQQEQAATHVNGPALVLAGPGSGKTTVITARTAYIIMEAGVSPESILTLTFNRAARYEMERRFSRIFGGEIGRKVRFSTLHSFCNVVVRDYEKRQGKRLKRIEGDENIHNSKRIILKNIYRQINAANINDDELENLINEIGFAKNSMIKEFTGINFKTRNFDQIYCAYEDYKRANLFMDFDDMLTYAYSIFNKCPDILMYYKNKYQYIQVDEGQDLSKIQFEILKMLAGSYDSNLFVVADDDQSIYGFRGAQPQHILEMEQQFEGCRLYRLEKNYRSSRNIVEISSNFIKKNKLRYDKNHITENNDKYDPFIISVRDEIEQPDFIVKIIKERFKSDEGGSIAVLFRNNLSSVAIVDELDRNKINFHVRQNRLFFFKHWIVQDILAFLKFSQDQTDSEAFMQIYYKMNRYISKAMVEYALQDGSGESVIDGIMNFDELKPYQRKTMIELKIEFKRLAVRSPIQALDYIEDSFRYFDSVREYCENTGLSFDYLYGLFGILRTIAYRYSNIQQFLVRMEELEKILEGGGYAEKGRYVTLTTMHSSKGLEYDCVVMVDLNNTEIPGKYAAGISSKDSEDSLMEEERRLFYVGMTRAKTYLYLVWPENKGGMTEPRSVFVDEVIRCMNGELLNEIGEGVIVYHRKFGEGVIAAVYEHNNSHTLLEIDFGGVMRRLDFEVCMESGLLEF